MTVATIDQPRKRAGRKTNLERAEIALTSQKAQADTKIEALKIERYLRQEEKRVELVQIDQKPTLILLIVLTLLAFLGGALLTANATIDVAVLMGLPAGWDWMRGGAFAAIEVAILGFLLGYLMIGSRPYEDAEKEASIWWKLMVGFSSITILSSAFHTVRFHEYDFSNPETWAGLVMATVIPLSYVLMSKMLSVAVFARSIRL